nr:hypothetical protein [Methanosphaera stadtmanae]
MYLFPYPEIIINSPTFSTLPNGTTNKSPLRLAPLTLTALSVSVLIIMLVILPVFSSIVNSSS